jgi:predicted O-methyltransferase YrrM
MQASDVASIVGELPWMGPTEGDAIVSHVREHGARHVLELGFYHGVSTCYLAAGVGELGSVTTIDRVEARALEPNVETLLERCGLRERVTVYYEPRSYNWRLMKLLEADPAPRFDLCFIDGAHSWAEDGFAFFLVDRLLLDGGWIIFDDIDWSVATAPDAYSRSLAGKLTAEESATAQIRRVYELLVKTHPSYGDFRVEAHWAYAHKLGSLASSAVRTETVVKTLPVPVAEFRELMRWSRRRRA